MNFLVLTVIRQFIFHVSVFVTLDFDMKMINIRTT